MDAFEVKDIISKGGVPLVMMKLGSAKLTVTKAKPWTEYIAVSHVWSGGLGNPDHNSLPRCQILRLQKYYRYQTRAQRSILFRLNRLFRSDLVSLFSPQTMYFWMDTLYIPTSGGTIKEKAIQHMPAIYAGASQVLVLDAELQQISAKKPNGQPRSNNDIVAHVLCSAWMGRAWTLQEGALGKECHFQFKDVSRCIRFKNLLEDERNVSKATKRLSSGTTVDCSQLIVRLSSLVIDILQSERQYLSFLPEGTRKDRLSKAWRIPQLVRVWNSLLWRESSYKKDIYAIFANLLDFNTYLLHPSAEGSQPISPEQANIPVLIRSCKELPLSLLYNRGPHIKSLDCPQNGWIPVETIEDGLTGDKLTEGAVLRWKGYSLDIDASRVSRSSLFLYTITPLLERRSGFCIRDKETSDTFIVQIQDVANSDDTVDLDSDQLFEEAAQELYEQGLGTCIILDTSTGTLVPDGHAATGARFSISKFDGRVVTLRYDKPLVAYKDTQFRPPLPEQQGSVVVAENCIDTHRFVLKFRKFLPVFDSVEFFLP